MYVKIFIYVYVNALSILRYFFISQNCPPLTGWAVKF